MCPSAVQGARRAAGRGAGSGGGEAGGAMAMGMQRFVKQIMELWRGGFDSQRVLMTQVAAGFRFKAYSGFKLGKSMRRTI